MEKSSDAFRTISEVAAELGVQQHVLRFWETRFSQIKPMKRGGNRRYYRPADINLLRGIKYFLYEEGYTIKGLQRLLRQNGVGFVKDFDIAPQPGVAGVGSDGALAGASLTQDSPPIPDLAGEAARHAATARTKPAASRAKAKPRSRARQALEDSTPKQDQTAKSAKPAGKKKASSAQGLSAAQRKALLNVLDVLESCQGELMAAHQDAES